MLGAGSLQGEQGWVEIHPPSHSFARGGWTLPHFPGSRAARGQVLHPARDGCEGRGGSWSWWLRSGFSAEGQDLVVRAERGRVWGPAWQMLRQRRAGSGAGTGSAAGCVLALSGASLRSQHSSERGNGGAWPPTSDLPQLARERPHCSSGARAACPRSRGAALETWALLGVGSPAPSQHLWGLVPR